MKEQERCVDPQLWHACAGGMVSTPALNSLVYYFPQGHAKQAHAAVDLGSCPPFILCKVCTIDYKTGAETDDVFSLMKLLPAKVDDRDCSGDDTGSDSTEKPPSFCENVDAVGRQQWGRLLGAAILHGDHLPSAGLHSGPTCADGVREGCPRPNLEVSTHLPRKPSSASTNDRLEQLHEPEEARGRRLRRVLEDA